MAYPEIIANWASAGGGHSDVELQPGTYSLEADDIKTVFGPRDEDFVLYRPALTVAKITRSTRSVPHDPEDGFFDEVTDDVIGDPLDAAGFSVPVAGLYRMAWGGKGTVALVQVQA
jgi:hypothetical protein